MLHDPGLYDFAPWREDRPKIEWPNGARVAFWVAPNIEHYELFPPMHPKKSPWPKPNPDVVGYSWRDFGNRVGFDRMADSMEKYGVRGSVSLNVAVCDHYPEIIERCVALGWELFSHGTYNTRYQYGMSTEQQRRLIADSRDTILKASGQRLDGWLSPAITNDDETPHILAEEGILYTLDSFEDDQPMPYKTRSGKLVSLPYGIEINDVPVLVQKQHTPDEYADICIAHFNRLYAEGEKNGTVMCMPLHPYLMGAAHINGAFERVLEHVTSHDDVWLATGREIATYWKDNYWDEVSAWIANVNEGGDK